MKIRGKGETGNPRGKWRLETEAVAVAVDGLELASLMAAFRGKDPQHARAAAAANDPLPH